MQLIIAHRGDTQSFQENTLNAFISAFDKGANGVEMDIQLWKNEIILVHDYLFDHSATYPTLLEILSAIHNRGRLEIEIKEMEPTILKPLEEILLLYPKSDIELTTSEIPLLPFIKKNISDRPAGMNISTNFFEDWMTNDLVTKKILGWASMLQVDVIHLPFLNAQRCGSENLVQLLHTAGFRVHIHIPTDGNQKNNFLEISTWNIDQCSIDDLSLIKAI
ncbi:MAG: hypothetical protein COU66_00765 [Candidatus Pacebacteria bacterium CG10_big_fil_rev_8_21_14_0_10_44_11]|nr:MAG: hypothetical protein COU66_00765 [Candidatus Pacebacteria bacterium CG10_big_fil_rev_8_21_14_0_10_44_11]